MATTFTPSPAEHARILCEAYGAEQARWYAETNADTYHAATKEYWRLVAEAISRNETTEEQR